MDAPLTAVVAPSAPPVGTPVERVLARAGSRLDRAVSGLLRGEAWFLRVGLAAVLASLLAHTPNPAAYRWFVEHDRSRVLAMQVEHPLTPLLVNTQTPGQPLEGVGDAAHLEKIAFRLTIPVLGRLCGTGAASWLIFSCVAGLTFFPMFAWAIARWTDDRLSAAYLTLAFAATWVGGNFFNDNFYGDGVAWTLLLAAMALPNPGVIFVATLAAAFTDERAVLGSLGAVFFWTVQPVSASPVKTGRGQRLAVLAALVAYLVLRQGLGQFYGLALGHEQLFNLGILAQHLILRLPYVAFDVFKGLWAWFALGLLGLAAARRWWAATTYLAIGTGLTAAALAVYDLDRSLGYLLVLLPTAFCWGRLPADKHRWLARAACVVSFLFFVPWNTPLRYLFQVISGVQADQVTLPSS